MVFLIFDFARDLISQFALLAVAHEGVPSADTFDGSQGPNRFRVEAGPKQSEVPDMSVNFAPCQADPVLCFGDHSNDFGRGQSIQFTNTHHRIGFGKADQQVADVVHELGIRDPEDREERVFGKTGKVTLEDPIVPGHRSTLELHIEKLLSTEPQEPFLPKSRIFLKTVSSQD